MNKDILILLGIALCSIVSAASVPSPTQFHKDLLRAKRSDGNSLRLGNAVGYLHYKAKGYLGLRSVFQWNFGRVTKYNNGFFNFLQFKATHGGYIGLQNFQGGRNYNILFSIWGAISAQAGTGFKCQRFTGEGEGYQCFQRNYALEDHKLYFLDVEISNKTITAYISEPQTTLDTFQTAVNRTMIGAITLSKVQANLRPYGYFMENYCGEKSTCTYAQDLTVVNFASCQYKKYEQLMDANLNLFKLAKLYNSDCKEVNQLITLTAKKDALVYLTRPTIY